VQPEVLDSGHVAATRGASVEHRKGTERTDTKFHWHCQGRWQGSVSLGFDARGKRIRRRVTGPTKTAVMEAMAELREQLGRAPRSSAKATLTGNTTTWPGLAGSTGIVPARRAPGEEVPGGRQVTPCRQQNVDDLAVLVDSPVEIGPFAGDLHVGSRRRTTGRQGRAGSRPS